MSSGNFVVVDFVEMKLDYDNVWLVIKIPRFAVE